MMMMIRSPKRGPARPLNFFGYLTSTAMNKLEEAILTPELYNHTFMVSACCLIDKRGY